VPETELPPVEILWSFEEHKICITFTIFSIADRIFNVISSGHCSTYGLHGRHTSFFLLANFMNGCLLKKAQDEIYLFCQQEFPGRIDHILSFDTKR
jgi:hypothetical protein